MNEITVYRTWEEPMADMAVDLLRQEGIAASKISQVPKSVYAFTVDGLGEVEIRVPEEDAERAHELLKVRFSGESGEET